MTMPFGIASLLHVGWLVRFIFNFIPSTYESMKMKIVHIGVQCVSIVCLNVLSTLFSYFSLTKQQKKNQNVILCDLKGLLGCFCIMLINSSFGAATLRTV